MWCLAADYARVATSDHLRRAKKQAGELLCLNTQLLSDSSSSAAVGNAFKGSSNSLQEKFRISICIYFTTRICLFGRKPCTGNLVRMLRKSLDGCLKALPDYSR